MRQRHGPSGSGAFTLVAFLRRTDQLLTDIDTEISGSLQEEAFMPLQCPVVPEAAGNAAFSACR